MADGYFLMQVMLRKRLKVAQHNETPWGIMDIVLGNLKNDDGDAVENVG